MEGVPGYLIFEDEHGQQLWRCEFRFVRVPPTTVSSAVPQKIVPFEDLPEGAPDRLRDVPSWNVVASDSLLSLRHSCTMQVVRLRPS